MKYYKSLLPIFCIVFTFAYPTKKDFSEAFIQVAEVGNPTIVSIISEKVVETNFHKFFEPFDDSFIIPKNSPDDFFRTSDLFSDIRVILSFSISAKAGN